MKPIDAAWSLLKALPEQQVYAGDKGPVETGRGDVRLGTAHPAIEGLLSRKQRRKQPKLEVATPYEAPPSEGDPRIEDVVAPPSPV
tara:strand:- start:818 stop:1075 length:258 start_codon:yes stop_codon:yes gene_type:complete